MNSFVEYMDRIKAEEKLKRDTAVFVCSALAVSTQQGENEKAAIPAGKRRLTKRLAAAMLSLAACAVLVFAGYKYYYTPVYYVSLDINPSVELGLNRLEKIVFAESYNTDGDLLLKESRPQHQSLEEAINTLVSEAVRQGFIDDDGSTVIAITAESDDEEAAAALHEAGRTGANQALDSCDAKAVIYCGYACPEMRNAARAMGVSPGKYKLITILQELEPGTEAETYKDAKITDIITKVNECMLSCPNGALDGENEQYLETIAQAAEDVLTAKAGGKKCAGSGENVKGQKQEAPSNKDICGNSQSGDESGSEPEQGAGTDSASADAQAADVQTSKSAQAEKKEKSKLQKSSAKDTAADVQNESASQNAAADVQDESASQDAATDGQDESASQNAAADGQDESASQNAAADEQDKSTGQDTAEEKKQSGNSGKDTVADVQEQSDSQGNQGNSQDNNSAKEQKQSDTEEKGNKKDSADDKAQSGGSSEGSNNGHDEKAKD